VTRHCSPGVQPSSACENEKTLVILIQLIKEGKTIKLSIEG